MRESKEFSLISSSSFFRRSIIKIIILFYFSLFLKIYFVLLTNFKIDLETIRVIYLSKLLELDKIMLQKLSKSTLLMLQKIDNL